MVIIKESPILVIKFRWAKKKVAEATFKWGLALREHSTAYDQTIKFFTNKPATVSHN